MLFLFWSVSCCLSRCFYLSVVYVWFVCKLNVYFSSFLYQYRPSQTFYILFICFVVILSLRLELFSYSSPPSLFSLPETSYYVPFTKFASLFIIAYLFHPCCSVSFMFPVSSHSRPSAVDHPCGKGLVHCLVEIKMFAFELKFRLLNNLISCKTFCSVLSCALQLFY